MTHDQRVTWAQKLSYLVLGFAIAAACVPPFWLTWGRDAVRLAAKQPAEDPAAVAERCVFFWFGADPREKFDVLKRMCPRPRDSRKKR